MKRLPRKFLCLIFCLVALAMFTHSSAFGQSLYTVNINTSGLNMANGGLAFDLVAGDGATPNNTVTISSFSSDATLLGANNSNSGSAVGDLPGALTLQDTGFSESFRGVTLGTTISYTLSLTTNNVPTGVDEFAFFITNLDNTGSLVSTSDPTGSDALFTVDIDSTPGGQLSLYSINTPDVSYTVTPFSASVPEPTPLCMVVAGLAFAGVVFGGWNHRRHPRARSFRAGYRFLSFFRS